MPETLTLQKTSLECPYCLTKCKDKLTLQNHIIDTKLCFMKAEQDMVKTNPLRLIDKEYLTIKTKAGGIAKLVPSGAQRIVLAKIKELLAQNKPIRLWILKARQSWVSTVIEAIIYSFVSQRQGINAIVIADELKKSSYLFEMQKTFYDTLPDHLKPKIKHSNEKKLEFNKIHSQVLIDTADSVNVGRTLTIQFCHLSECAFYPEGKLENLLFALGHSVPNLAYTMIIGETTANGFEKFHDEWMKAIDGKSDWLWLFIAWTQCPDYVLPLQNEKFYSIEGIHFATNGEREAFLAEETELLKTLSKEQINYRRWDIVNNCGGSVLKFRQEMPLTWEEAFVATGDLYFDRAGLLKQKEIQPEKIGNIVKLDGKYIFREDGNGRFKIYEFPLPQEQYIVTGDTAEGLAHGDESVWFVGNKRTNKTACVYNHRIPPDEFAQDGIMVASFYNNAIIAPENKGYGYGVCQDIYKQYGNIYRNIKTKTGSQVETNDLGFNNTGKVIRNQMLAQMNEEIKENATELLDKDLIRQCWTFANIDGKAQAQAGKNDDIVISRAIFSIIRNQFPYVQSSFHDKMRESYHRKIVKPNQGMSFKGIS